ncbi:MAG: hypothetical protein R3E39_28945 [Anaerolineae bacterium]
MKRISLPTNWLAVGLMLLVGCAAQPVDETVTVTPEVVYFKAEPDTVDRNETVTLSWHVNSVETVNIQQRYGSYKQSPDREYNHLPAEGSLNIDLTRRDVEGAETTRYINNVSFWLMTPGEADSPWTPGNVFLAGVGVTIRCSPETFFFGKDPYLYSQVCPLDDPQHVQSIYQRYEHGMLLWRADNSTIYVLRFRWVDDKRQDGTALRFSNNPIPPEEATDNPFGEFLRANHLHGIVVELGAAVEPPTSYTMTAQDSYNDTFSNAISYMTLPSGDVIRYLEDIYTAGWRCMVCAAP